MNPIYINGIGAVIPETSELEEIWNLLEKNTHAITETKIQEIPPFISSRKIRRMDRLSVLTLYGVYSVFKDLNELKGDLDPYDVGTIYNSDFGSLNTILEFAGCLPADSETEPSPVMFANTVLNACVGHLCIQLGLKGVSTMMLASNYVGYAMQLIKLGRAKRIAAGGLDEYNQELFATFAKRGIGVREGVSTIVLADEQNPDTFCEVVAYSEMNLHAHYCFDAQFKPNQDDIKQAINNVLVKANLDASQISAIITASDNQEFTNTEVEVINDVFGIDIPILHPKYTLGELLGASLGMNLTVGALVLKKQKLPISVEEEQELKYVLVNDFNIHGNYTTFILKSCVEGKDINV